jgi:hypothetical protein
VIEILGENGYRDLKKEKERKNLASEIKKIKTLTSLFAASVQLGKGVEAKVSAAPDISVQVQLFETPAENLSDQSDLLSQEKFPEVGLFILLKTIQYFAFVVAYFQTEKLSVEGCSDWRNVG